MTYTHHRWNFVWRLTERLWNFKYCKRRNFRWEFNFVAFVQLKNVRNWFSIPNFLPPACRLSIVSSSLYFFRCSVSTQLNSIQKVLDGKVRNVSPTKISSFTVPFVWGLQISRSDLYITCGTSLWFRTAGWLWWRRGRGCCWLCWLRWCDGSNVLIKHATTNKHTENCQAKLSEV